LFVPACAQSGGAAASVCCCGFGDKCWTVIANTNNQCATGNTGKNVLSYLTKKITAFVISLSKELLTTFFIHRIPLIRVHARRNQKNGATLAGNKNKAITLL
jgi:hypothetical protein